MKKMKLRIKLYLILSLLAAASVNAQNYTFDEEFSNNSNSWPVSTTSGGIERSVSGGKYVWDGSSSTMTANWELVPMTLDQSQDFVMEMKFSKVSGPNSSGWGIGLIWGDMQNRFSCFGSGGYYAIINDIYARNPSDNINKGNSSNKMTVKKIGSTFQFYMNDKYLSEAPYKYFSPSKIGVYLYMDNVRIEVDYIRVSYLSESKPNTNTNNKGGSYVLKEEFSNNSNNWPLSGATGTTRSISGGKYTWEGNSSTYNSNWDFIPINLDQSSDFTIEMSIKKTAGTESDWGFGILWGDDQNRFTCWGSNGAYSYIGDIYTRNKSNAVNTGNSTNKMTVKKTGSKLEFYMNNTYLGQHSFERFSPNQIGIYSYMNDVRIEVDYLYITYSGSTVVDENTTTGNSPQEKLVSDFIDIWVNDSGNDDKLMEFISPKYLKDNNLKKSEYNVNLYYPKGFAIKSFDDKTGRVTVNVWGENKTWVHKLVFKVVKEGSKYYFYPSQFTTSMYIYPWESVETNVTDDSYTTPTASPESVISDFLDIWVNDSGNDDKLMEFISPKYLSDNYLDKTKYNVNLYYPKGYKIESTDNNTNRVTVLIWGENKSWMHRLVFKMSLENGKYYCYPSQYTTSMYIYPWESVETDVKDGYTKPQKSIESVVSDFIDVWVNDKDNDDKLMTFIAPSYFNENLLNESEYNVNLYYPKDYKIENTDNINNKVTVLIWGENKGWIHRLVFKLVEEDGSWYLWPSQFTDSKYIYPWESVETNVSETTTKPEVKKTEPEQDPSLLGDEARLVFDFLKIMKDDQYNNSAKMKFMSPKFMKKNNLDPNEYNVNTYSIGGFNVKKFDKETGIVQASIWDGTWSMKLEFKVVREDGKLYLYPSKIWDNKYLDPWVNASTE